MNRIYKLVWSKVKGCYVVASELAKSRKKGICGARLRSASLVKSVALALALGAGVLAAPALTYALPQGGVAGPNVAINTAGNQMDITSSVKNNVINWSSFDIAKGETVRFDNGAFTNNYLNLIKSVNPSVIDGTLKGGNKVFLVNPNGVIFGAGSVVNVGNLVVSTVPLDKVNSEEFFAGNGNIPWDKATGDVINMGNLQADTVYINGKNIRIENSANIQARDGVTQLRGDDKVELDASQGIEIWHPWGEDYNSLGWYKQSMTNAGSDATLVTEASQFRSFSQTGSYVQANDIYNFGSNCCTARFSGKYNGNGYAIYGVNTAGGGIFEWARNATIENVYLVNPSINGSSDGDSGAIVNYCLNSTVTGRVEGLSMNAGTANGGGLVGKASESTIIGTVYNATIYCSANADGDSNSSGGLVGLSDSSVVQGIVKNLKLDGTVNAPVLGGLVGTAAGNSNISGICTGEIRGIDKSCSGIGGLVGKAQGPGYVYIKGIFNGNISGGWENVGYLLGKFSASDVAVDFRGIAGGKRSGEAEPTGIWVLPDGLKIGDVDRILANAKIYDSSYLGWSVAATANSSNTWRLYEGYTSGQPIFVRGTLKKLDTPLDSWKKTEIYTGSKVTIPVSGAVYKALTTTGTDAGIYNITSGVYSNEYDAWGQITINPMPLYLKKNSTEITKVYDGTTATSSGLNAYFDLTDASGNKYTSGVVVNQGVKLNSGLMGEYADKDVANGKTVSFTSDSSTPFFSGGTGFKADNYTFQKLASDTGYTIDGSSIELASGKITPRDIYLTRSSTEITKEYDGNTEVKQGFSNLYDLSGNDTKTQGLIASEGIKVNDAVKGVYSKSATAPEGYLDKDVETADKTVTFTENDNKFITGTPSNFKLSNYNIKIQGTSTAVDKNIETKGKITPKDLAVSVQMEQTADGPQVKGVDAQGWVTGEGSGENFTTQTEPAGGRTKVTAVKTASFDAAYKQNYKIVSSTDTYINSNKSYTQYSADGKKVVTVNTDKTEIAYTDTGSGKNIEVKKPDGTPSKQIDLAGAPTVNDDGSMSTTKDGTDTTVFVDGGMQIKKGGSTIGIDKNSEKIIVKNNDVIVEGEIDTVPKVDVNGNVDVLKNGVTTTYKPGGEVVVCKGGTRITTIAPDGTVVLYNEDGTTKRDIISRGNVNVDTEGNVTVDLKQDTANEVKATVQSDRTVVINDAAAGNATITVSPGNDKLTIARDGTDTVVANLPGEAALDEYGNLKYAIDGGTTKVSHDGSVKTVRTVGGDTSTVTVTGTGKNIHLEKSNTTSTIDIIVGPDDTAVIGTDGSITARKGSDTRHTITVNTNGTVSSNNGEKKSSMVVNLEQTKVSVDRNGTPVVTADLNGNAVVSQEQTEVTSFDGKVKTTFTMDGSVTAVNGQAGTKTEVDAVKGTIAVRRNGGKVADIYIGGTGQAVVNTGDGSMQVKIPVGMTTVTADGSVEVKHEAIGNSTVVDSRTKEIKVIDGKTGRELTKVGTARSPRIDDSGVATIFNDNTITDILPDGRVEIIGPNGAVLNRVTTAGVVELLTADGGVKNTVPIPEGTIPSVTDEGTIVVDNERGTTGVRADGVIDVYNNSYKSTTSISADNKNITVDCNGRRILYLVQEGSGTPQVDKAGRVFFVRPGGNITVIYPDGTKVTYTPTGQVVPEAAIESVIRQAEKLPEAVLKILNDPITVQADTVKIAVEYSDSVESGGMRTWERVGADDNDADGREDNQ